jgi:hypothetical protein
MIRNPQQRTSRSSTALGQPSGLFNPDAATAEKTRPVHRIRHGAISASIWQQQTAKGPMFNVTFQRSYKDGDQWKTSACFGQKHLLVLSLLAAKAYEWIAEWRQQMSRGVGPETQSLGRIDLLQ